MTHAHVVDRRPLGIITSVLERLGFAVSHAYDDLIFVEHNAFLLRMEEVGAELSLFFNVDSDEDKRQEIIDMLSNEGIQDNLVITCCGTYSVTPDEENETLSLTFFETKRVA